MYVFVICFCLIVFITLHVYALKWKHPALMDLQI